jgi:MFS family permease
LRRARLLIALTIFLLSAAVNLPAPLYQVYAGLWSLSVFQITCVYCIYSISLAPLVLVMGLLSDAFGRRPLLVLSGTATAVAMILLATASGFVALLAGRFLLAVAVGAFNAGGVPALVELGGGGDGRAAGIISSIAQTIGGAVGPVVAGLSVAYLPYPLVTPYMLELVVAVAIAIACTTIPETRRPNTRRSVSPGGLRVQGWDLVDFWLAATIGILAWAIGAFFMAVMPSYVSAALGESDPLGGGLAIMVMLVVSSVCQVGVRSQPMVRIQLASLLAASAGLILIGLAPAFHSLVTLLVASAVSGVGMGLGFVGGVIAVNELAPPERRGAVIAWFFGVVYFGSSLPLLLLGYVAGFTKVLVAGEWYVFSFAALALLLVFAVLLRQGRDKRLSPSPA